MKTHARQPQLSPSVTPEAECALSPQRAFVVQFREAMDATLLRFRGRVEHIVSGHAARFSSPEELLAFFARILVDVGTSDNQQ